MRKQKKLNTSDFEFSEIPSEIVDHKKGTIVNYLEEIGLLREVKKFDLYQRNNKAFEPILKGHEIQNVEVHSGFNVKQIIFLKFFFRLITTISNH